MSFDDLTITVDYIDYDILEEEKTISKNDKVLNKTKKTDMEREGNFNSLQ